MWIMTKEGFVSIVDVKVKNDIIYAVRARSRKQLRDFLEAYLKLGSMSSKRFNPDILDTKESDYRFRVYVDKTQLDLIFKQLSMSISYSNFKAACVGDSKYNLFLHRVWDLGASMFGAYGSKGKD
jgi:hypothetical protein